MCAYYVGVCTCVYMCIYTHTHIYTYMYIAKKYNLSKP